MGDREPRRSPSRSATWSRTELVRPSRRSSMAGEREYAFWHVLARDVAYAPAAAGLACIAPRRSRDVDRGEGPRIASRTSPTSWPTTTRRALDLARATGDEAQATALRDPAFRFLSLAGERAPA